MYSRHAEKGTIRERSSVGERRRQREEDERPRAVLTSPQLCRVGSHKTPTHGSHPTAAAIKHEPKVAIFTQCCDTHFKPLLYENQRLDIMCIFLFFLEHPMLAMSHISSQVLFCAFPLSLSFTGTAHMWSCRLNITSPALLRASIFA